jgi:hypothetical protein
MLAFGLRPHGCMDAHDEPRPRRRRPERPAPPATPPPGTLGTPAEESAPPSERPPLRPMKRNGRRWRANVKSSPKTTDLDRDFRRRAG